MERIKVFLNPKASGGENPLFIETLSKKLFRSQLQFVEAKNLEELKKEILAAVNEKFDAVIAVGGDGTANLMAQGLVGTETALLLVPAGTANDLACELNLSLNMEGLP